MRKHVLLVLAAVGFALPAFAQSATNPGNLEVVGPKHDREPFTRLTPSLPARVQYSEVGKSTVMMAGPPPSFGAIVTSEKRIGLAWDAPSLDEAVKAATNICQGADANPDCQFTRVLSQGECAAIAGYAVENATHFIWHFTFAIGNSAPDAESAALTTCRAEHPNEAYSCKIQRDEKKPDEQEGKPQVYCHH